MALKMITCSDLKHLAAKALEEKTPLDPFEDPALPSGRLP